jgi:hypothetical protein
MCIHKEIEKNEIPCRISTAILAIITIKFFKSEVIMLEDFATIATILYNKLD